MFSIFTNAYRLGYHSYQTQKQLEYQMAFFSFPNIFFSFEFVSHCSIVCFLYWKLQTSKKAERNCILDQVYVLYAEVALLGLTLKVATAHWIRWIRHVHGIVKVQDMVFMCHVCLPSWANLVLLNPGRGCVFLLPSKADDLEESPLTPPPCRVAGSESLLPLALLSSVAHRSSKVN